MTVKKGRNMRMIKDVRIYEDISERDIMIWKDIDYPVFSFKYLRDEESVSDCKDASFFKDFLKRLKDLSELGWREIRKSHRHSFEMEKIPKREIIPVQKLPRFVTSEVDLDVFRASGDNRVFVGLQQGKIFHIFFIECRFGDIYNHGTK